MLPSCYLFYIILLKSLWSHLVIIFVQSPYAEAKLSIAQGQLAFTMLALCAFYAALIYILKQEKILFDMNFELLFNFISENNLSQ